MKRAAIRASLLLALVVPAAAGWAASGEAKSAARPLDLSVPRDVVQPAAGDGPFLPGATRYGMGFEARRNLEASTSSSPGGANVSPPHANAVGGGPAGRGATAAPPTPPAPSAGGPRGGGGGGRRR